MLRKTIFSYAMWLERPVFSRASVQPVHSGLVPSKQRSSAVSSRGRWSERIQEFEATVTGLLLFFSHANKSTICHLRPIEADHEQCFCRLFTFSCNLNKKCILQLSGCLKSVDMNIDCYFPSLDSHLDWHCEIMCQKEASIKKNKKFWGFLDRFLSDLQLKL